MPVMFDPIPKGNQVLSTDPEQVKKFIKRKYSKPKPKPKAAPSKPAPAPEVEAVEDKKLIEETRSLHMDLKPKYPESPVKEIPGGILTKEQYITKISKTRKTLKEEHTELVKARESIDPSESYTYTSPKTGRTTTALGSTIISLYYDPAIEQYERNIEEYDRAYYDAIVLQRDTKIKTTREGYQIIPRDTRLEWAEQEIRKGESLPPVVKELYMFGYGIGKYKYALPAGEGWAEAHNEYIQLFFEGGRLAVISVLGYIGARIIDFIRMDNNYYKQILICGLMCIGINCMVNFTFHRVCMLMMCLTYIGMWSGYGKAKM